jgi:hypothetical protein
VADLEVAEAGEEAEVALVAAVRADDRH